MKDAYWFKHDSNARHDPDIVLLLGEYGHAGYGIYWMIIETLRDADGNKLKKKHIAAFSKNFAYDLLDDLLAFCLRETDLFEEDDEFFWSNSLIRRLEKHEQLKEIRVEAGRKGGQIKPSASKSQANGKQKPSNSEAKGKHLDLGEEREKDIKRDDDTPKESGSVCDNGHKYHGSFCRQCIKDEREAASVDDDDDEF